jgi:hypothetical protein
MMGLIRSRRILRAILPRIKPRSRTPEPVELRDKSLSWSFFERGENDYRSGDHLIVFVEIKSFLSLSY